VYSSLVGFIVGYYSIAASPSLPYTHGEGGQERRANLLLHFPVSWRRMKDETPNELPSVTSSVKGYGRFLDFALLPTMTGHSPLALHLSPRQRNSQSVGRNSEFIDYFALSWNTYSELSPKQSLYTL